MISINAHVEVLVLTTDSSIHIMPKKQDTITTSCKSTFMGISALFIILYAPNEPVEKRTFELSFYTSAFQN